MHCSRHLHYNFVVGFPRGKGRGMKIETEVEESQDEKRKDQKERLLAKGERSRETRVLAREEPLEDRKLMDVRLPSLSSIACSQ